MAPKIYSTAIFNSSIFHPKSAWLENSHGLTPSSALLLSTDKQRLRPDAGSPDEAGFATLSA